MVFLLLVFCFGQQLLGQCVRHHRRHQSPGSRQTVESLESLRSASTFFLVASWMMWKGMGKNSRRTARRMTSGSMQVMADRMVTHQKEAAAKSWTTKQKRLGLMSKDWVRIQARKYQRRTERRKAMTWKMVQ